MQGNKAKPCFEVDFHSALLDLGLSALAAGSAGDAASAMVGAQVSYYSGASFGMLFGLTYLCLSLPMIAQATDMFQKVLEKGLEYAKKDNLITFGVIPKYPETSYGYIESENIFSE